MFSSNVTLVLSTMFFNYGRSRTFIWLLYFFGGMITLIKSQSRDLIENLEDIIAIREETRRFNIDRDYYFDFQTDYIPSIVRSGLSPTTGDVTLVIRFATMLNLAR